MRIAICDDEGKDSAFIEDYFMSQKTREIICDVFASGEELLRYQEINDIRYDVFFLDIEMSGRNGIQIAKVLRKTNSQALIIYVTSYQNYVYDVFETLPFRFLRKPLQRADIEKTWQAVEKYRSTNTQIFSFIQNRYNCQVLTGDIMYFESSGRKVTLHTKKENYIFYDRLYHVYSVLSQRIFLKPHSSYIVNMDYIFSIRKKEIILTDKTVIPISNRYTKAVKECYFDYIQWRHL